MCYMPGALFEPVPANPTAPIKTVVKLGRELYVRSADRMSNEPICTISYRKLTLSAEQMEYYNWKWGELGRLVAYARNNWEDYKTIDEGPYATFSLVNRDSYADYYENIAIPKPRQRGKVCPIRYFDGYWHKETAKGWTIAE